MRRALIVVCAFALLVAIGVQFRVHGRGSAGKGQHLADTFSKVNSASSAKELELGATESVRSAVERILRYDDVLFREYSLKAGVVTVYVAYWGPGRMPTQLVASHTPDRCWVENGWVCEQNRHDVSEGITASNFLPGEWRVFKAPGGQKLNVIFWHLVGNEVYDYGNRLNRVPSAWRWWRDAARQVFQTPAEQYFIRVTSDAPFETLHNDPGWKELLSALAQLGLSDDGRQRAEKA